MSHHITVSLSDSAFSTLHQKAQEANTAPAELASAALEHQFGEPKAGEQPAGLVGRERFERHFGAVAIGRSADNDSIDADLAREYSDSHETV